LTLETMPYFQAGRKYKHSTEWKLFLNVVVDLGIFFHFPPFSMRAGTRGSDSWRIQAKPQWFLATLFTHHQSVHIFDRYRKLQTQLLSSWAGIYKKSMEAG
jgi:hypothetical protein